MRAGAVTRSAALFLLLVVAAETAAAQLSDVGKDSLRSTVAPLRSALPLTAIPDVDGVGADLWRLAQLRGTSTAGFLMRTPSSMMTPVA